jgi:hypothetical protein
MLFRALVRAYYHPRNTGNTESQDITASCLERQVIMRALEWNSNMQARLIGEPKTLYYSYPNNENTFVHPSSMF